MRIFKDKKNFGLFILVLSSFAILLFFQNCGKVKFKTETTASTATGSSGNSGGNDGGSGGGSGSDPIAPMCENGASDYPTCMSCPQGDVRCAAYSDKILACYGSANLDDLLTNWRTYSQSAFIPFVPLVTPNVPANCSNGIELNNIGMSVYELRTNSVTPARQAWIDFGTYEVPDTLIISSVNGAGVKTVIFSQERISTHANPYTVINRPPDDRLRQAQLTIPAGTTKLEFDFSKACSPFYIRLQGLCDFNRNQLFPLGNADGGMGSNKVRLFPEGTSVSFR